LDAPPVKIGPEGPVGVFPEPPLPAGTETVVVGFDPGPTAVVVGFDPGPVAVTVVAAPVLVSVERVLELPGFVLVGPLLQEPVT